MRLATRCTGTRIRLHGTPRHGANGAILHGERRPVRRQLFRRPVAAQGRGGRANPARLHQRPGSPDSHWASRRPCSHHGARLFHPCRAQHGCARRSCGNRPYYSIPTTRIPPHCPHPPTLPHTPAPFADPTAFHVPDVHGKTDTCVAVPNLSLASQSLPDSASTDKSHDPKSEHRRQRNRKAAQHSRERKKQFIRGLEQRNAELEGLVVSLKREVEALQRQNGVRDAFVRCTLPIGTCHTQLCAGVASDHHQLEIQPSNLLRAVTDHDITFYRLLPGGA